MLRNGDGSPQQAVLGSFSFSTDGLGLAPGNPLNLIQASENAEESERLCEWFDAHWAALPPDGSAKTGVVDLLRSLAADRDPLSVYALILYHLLRTQGDELDEDQVVKSATGIRNTAVWQKLFKFQRDGVVGAIDKLNRFGGCIIADSVGLGKTFEALAVIKYHELRNDRGLVLCPKRLRDNWSLYRSNDRRNSPCRRPLQLRHPQPHRPVARRRAFRRHRPGLRELGKLRPRRHRRVPQLPQQAYPSPRRRDALRPPDAEDHPGRREDSGAHAVRHPGQQPLGRPAQPDRLRYGSGRCRPRRPRRR